VCVGYIAVRVGVDHTHSTPERLSSGDGSIFKSAVGHIEPEGSVGVCVIVSDGWAWETVGVSGSGKVHTPHPYATAYPTVTQHSALSEHLGTSLRDGARGTRGAIHFGPGPVTQTRQPQSTHSLTQGLWGRQYSPEYCSTVVSSTQTESRALLCSSVSAVNWRVGLKPVLRTQSA
jgi:hypothetical protein